MIHRKLHKTLGSLFIRLCPQSSEETLAAARSPWILSCLSPAINRRGLLCASLGSAHNGAPPPPLLKVHSNHSQIIYEHCSARPCPLAQPVGDTQRHCRPTLSLTHIFASPGSFSPGHWKGKGQLPLGTKLLKHVQWGGEEGLLLERT